MARTAVGSLKISLATLLVASIWYPDLVLIPAALMAALCLTIIGIPIAVILAKSLSTYFNPVNKICVKSSVAEELDKREALSKLNNSN